jgi:hypothetical protein
MFTVPANLVHVIPERGCFVSKDRTLRIGPREHLLDRLGPQVQRRERVVRMSAKLGLRVL